VEKAGEANGTKVYITDVSEERNPFSLFLLLFLFARQVFPPRRWRHYVPPQYLCTTKPDGVTSQSQPWECPLFTSSSFKFLLLLHLLRYSFVSEGGSLRFGMAVTCQVSFSVFSLHNLLLIFGFFTLSRSITSEILGDGTQWHPPILRLLEFRSSEVKLVHAYSRKTDLKENGWYLFAFVKTRNNKQDSSCARSRTDSGDLLCHCMVVPVWSSHVPCIAMCRLTQWFRFMVTFPRHQFQTRSECLVFFSRWKIMLTLKCSSE
jgi:hypothetical protein